MNEHEQKNGGETALGNALRDFVPDNNTGYPESVQQAAFLARRVQARALELQTPEEQKTARSLARLVDSPRDKAALIRLIDRSFRSRDPRRVTAQVRRLLGSDDIPGFMEGVDRTLMKIFVSFGHLLPGVSVPLFKKKIRSDTDRLILSAEPAQLEQHLRERARRGIRMNVNFLGEAVLGEKEAGRRFDEYLRALENPDVEVVSIKISTIYSQITSLGAAHCVDVLTDRLRFLYRTAACNTFHAPGGLRVPKFVYLDMEEYRDMRITAQAFMRALDDTDLKHTTAGIALQAYVPDSREVQEQITDWARARTAAGGAPVTIRIVKGANMEMEQVEASLMQWPQAVFTSKLDTDANFKCMLLYGLEERNIASVRLGVASHNLFDLCFALIHAHSSGVQDMVQFEMLEGMADPLRRAFQELTGNLLLYAPATRDEDFISAIGYLIRRMDENTAPDNFLRHSFSIRPGCAAWQRLEKDFLDSWTRTRTLTHAPRRTQNRLLPVNEAEAQARLEHGFANEPDTDFSLPQNVQWAQGIIDEWRPLHGERGADIPLVVDGADVFNGRDIRDCTDPSRPGVSVARFRLGTMDDVDRAVACAACDPDGWRALTHEQRAKTLARAAMEVRRARGRLIGAAMANGGKTITESDPEVSEAVDFLEYYPRAVLDLAGMDNLECRGVGAAVVISPWNFPIAIPCGGVAAALAAGNTVILKPSSDAIMPAWELCRCFWNAGVSRRTLQFLPCTGSGPGAALASHHRVSAVIFTGGTDTAESMLHAKPGMNLFAETGGKNATIITAMSDRDLAIKNVLHSAFGHSGQKCSATSLLILEKEVYEDENFRRQLADAVESLKTGPAWDLSTKIGPLIRPPGGALGKTLSGLDPGEEWLVAPRPAPDNHCLWSPGVRWGVQPGSFTHMTELFGPVLSVLRSENLAHALELANATGYGLTAGIESLDEDEQQQWRESAHAGNLYINRPTTGAIVLRQPFGGMGKSAFGPGIKAGGPNYPIPFMTFRESGPPGAGTDILDQQLSRLAAELPGAATGAAEITGEQLERIIHAIRSYSLEASREFHAEHDAFLLRGQDNIRRYLPVENLLIPVHAADSAFEIIARVCAARAAGCAITVSHNTGDRVPWIPMLRDLTAHWGASIRYVQQSDEAAARLIRNKGAGRVRCAAPDRVSTDLLRAAAQSGVYIAREPVLMCGRVELVWYMREQSISSNYHRYGNLGGRAAEPREPVA